MTLEEAREILEAWIDPDGSLRGCSRERCDRIGLTYVLWTPGDEELTIDGECNATLLRAILVWITQAAEETEHDPGGGAGDLRPMDRP
jgi:hypothetical protein